MPISTLRDSVSLETLSEELVFSETRLLVDDLTKELAPPISQLLVRLSGVRDGQFGAKHKEVAAQAAVTAVDDQLDDLVKDLAKELLRVVDDVRSGSEFLARSSPAEQTRTSSVGAGTLGGAAAPSVGATGRP